MLLAVLPETKSQDVYKRQAPKQVADIFSLHGFPALHIKAGGFGLRVSAVVMLKCPIPHSRVGKSPAFQVLHCFKAVSYTHLDVYKRQVQFRILRETVNKGQNHVAVENKPLARVGMGYIGHLLLRNVKLLCKDFPVALCLVEHIDKIAVFKNI